MFFESNTRTAKLQYKKCEKHDFEMMVERALKQGQPTNEDLDFFLCESLPPRDGLL